MKQPDLIFINYKYIDQLWAKEQQQNTQQLQVNS